MESDDALQIFFLILLVCLSAFFSSCETAFTTVNRIRIRSLSEEGNKKADRLLKILEDQGRLLSTILVGNNLVNISASSLATVIATRFLGSRGAGIATGTLTLIILVFGEISPKTITTLYSERIALAFSGVIALLMKLFTPVVFILQVLSGLFLKLLHIDKNKKTASITESELKTIVDVSHEEGVIEQEEREMIKNVVDFGDSTAKDVMVPRIDMICVKSDITYEELLKVFHKEMFTRLPVYDDSPDQITGIINMKDVLFYNAKEKFNIKPYMRKVTYTYETKKTLELLMEMRAASVNIEIVLDEYGATAGLVTLEDLLEEIVGEIRDEYDEDEVDKVKKIRENEYLVESSTNLDELNDMLGLSLSSKDYDTVGGYVIGLLDHLPKPGEKTSENGVTFIVQDVSKNRIGKIFIRMQSERKTQ